MDDNKRQRLMKKYGDYTVTAAPAGGMTVGPRGGGAMMKGAMGKTGKPKHALQTIGKLLRYLSKEKGLFLVALISALIHTGTTLAASYMLRPVMNRFLYYDPAQSDLTFRLYGLALGIAGFLIYQLGRIPDANENPSVEYEGLTFTVLEMEDRRIGTVHIEKCPETEE